MKFTMKIILTCVVCFFCLQVFGQDQASNLQKYWAYRERLRQRFMVVDQNVERFGVNIPASAVNLTDDIIEWGDGNNGMSHYLSMLSTELWLLKNNGEDYSETLKELYYAMLAMERMDYYSEYCLRLKAGIGHTVQGIWVSDAAVHPNEDRNGLHIRDDVTQGFWNFYKNHFPTTKFGSIFMGDVTQPETSMEEISQDNIYHNLEGLALVASLVGSESVASVPVTFVNPDTPNYLTGKGIKSGNTINFSLWAKDLVKRYIAYMQSNSFSWTMEIANLDIITLHNHWVILNPVTGDFVMEGSGRDFDMGLFYNAGVIKAGEAITGENLRTQDPFILSVGGSENLFTMLFEIGPQQTAVEYQSWPSPFDQVNDPIDVNILFDDYKVRTLASIGDPVEGGTFSFLRSHRDNSSVLDYEHMPMMFSVLHDSKGLLMFPGNTVYNNDRVLIENLLNSAPATGPKSNGNINWSSESRLVWPEKLGAMAAKDIEYSGLDYMVLHNLYYITFRREDFTNITIQNNAEDNAAYGNGSFRFREITAHNTIPVSGNATFAANKSISLKPGFLAPEGSQFSAVAEPRANNYQGVLYKKNTQGQGGRFGNIPSIEDQSVNEIYHVTFNNALSKPIPRDIMTRLETKDLNKINTLSSVRVSPNPADNLLRITLPDNDVHPLKVELFTLSGQLIFSKTSEGTKMDVDTSTLAGGMYIVKIYTVKGVEIEKITILH